MNQTEAQEVALRPNEPLTAVDSPLKCDICGKPLKTKAGVINHKRLAHGAHQQTQDRKANPLSPNQPGQPSGQLNQAREEEGQVPDVDSAENRKRGCETLYECDRCHSQFKATKPPSECPECGAEFETEGQEDDETEVGENESPSPTSKFRCATCKTVFQASTPPPNCPGCGLEFDLEEP